MVNIPCTIVLESLNKETLSEKMLYVACKDMFSYGVKKISQITDKVVVSLTYSPKNVTMRRKLGNLPVQYRRTNLDGDEELILFEKLIKTFKFNLREEEEGEEESTPPPQKKTKREPQPPSPPPPEPREVVSLLDDGEDDDFAEYAQRFVFGDE